MDALLRSPALFTVLAALVGLEWLALALWRSRTGRGVPLPELTAFLGAGACLFVALRGVAARSTLPAVGAPLLAALVCHLWLLRLLARGR